MNELLVLEIQRKLEEINYPTPLAISKEILQFTKGKKEKIDKILQRLKKDEPWEYIRGWTYFCKNKIFLNKNVLIPRVETEELVNIAVENIKLLKNDLQIFDVGTGSGCIAISLSKNFNHTIYAIDIDKEALEIARRNIEFNKCKNIEIVNANLLEFDFNPQKPTVIIANLPYIPSKEINKLQNSVKEYEPILALDGGINGTRYYTQLLEQIKLKDINIKYLLFEIDSENKKTLEKYKGKFLKDSFGKTRFLSILPSHLK
jgi:release factor glutamine methyltransferase